MKWIVFVLCLFVAGCSGDNNTPKGILLNIADSKYVNYAYGENTIDGVVYCSVTEMSDHGPKYCFAHYLEDKETVRVIYAHTIDVTHIFTHAEDYKYGKLIAKKRLYKKVNVRETSSYERKLLSTVNYKEAVKKAFSRS